MTNKFLSLFGRKLKDKDYYLKKIEAFHKNNPEITIRVYETFAGLRIIICNTFLKANDEFSKYIYAALEVDPLYVKLCNEQLCFRARLSPKPWRISLNAPDNSLRFPRKSEIQENKFNKWLKDYELKSTDYSSVKYLKTLGKNIHSEIQQVIEFHDKHALAGPKPFA